ncbi:MAG: hypothetical protein Q9P90_08700 [candidate division KSB1 bacterium]|nr:hypothetical protein [candidate division KSB1 bacterium]
MIRKLEKLTKIKFIYASMFILLILIMSQFFQNESLNFKDSSDLVVYYDLLDRQLYLPNADSQDFLNSTIVIFAFSANTCTECVIFHLKNLNALAQKFQATEDLIWVLSCNANFEFYKKVLGLKLPLISCKNLKLTTSWIGPEHFPLFIVLKHGKIEFAWRADPDKIDKSLTLIEKNVKKV